MECHGLSVTRSKAAAGRRNKAAYLRAVPQTPAQGLCARGGGIMNSPRPSRSSPRPSGTIVSSIVIVMSFVNKTKSLEYHHIEYLFPALLPYYFCYLLCGDQCYRAHHAVISQATGMMNGVAAVISRRPSFHIFPRQRGSKQDSAAKFLNSVFSKSIIAIATQTPHRKEMDSLECDRDHSHEVI